MDKPIASNYFNDRKYREVNLFYQLSSYLAVSEFGGIESSALLSKKDKIKGFFFIIWVSIN